MLWGLSVIMGGGILGWLQMANLRYTCGIRVCQGDRGR